MVKVVLFIIVLFLLIKLPILTIPITRHEAAAIFIGDYPFVPERLTITPSNLTEKITGLIYSSIIKVAGFDVIYPRILALTLSLATTTLLVWWVKKDTEKTKIYLIYGTLLAVSLGFGLDQITNLNISLSWLLLALALFFISKNLSLRVNFYTGIMVVFATLLYPPIIFISFYLIYLLIKQSNLQGVKKVVFKWLPYLALTAILLSSFNQTFLVNLKPSEYLWRIDRRLAYDQVEKSPLYTTGFNYNRFIHNKVVYSINLFFYQAASAVDFDKISSMLQYPLEVNPTNDYLTIFKLPKVMFIEWLFILLGAALMVNTKRYHYLVLVIMAFIGGVIFYKVEGSFTSMLPLLILPQALILNYLLEQPKSKIFKSMIFLLAMVWALFLITSVDLLINHHSKILPEHSAKSLQVWAGIKDNADGFEKITVTKHIVGTQEIILYKFINSRKRNITYEAVNKFYFAGFKYLESDRKRKQLWIGMGSEFVGKYIPYKDVTSVPDGEILFRIKDVRQPDFGLGDEVWAVRTTFN